MAFTELELRFIRKILDRICIRRSPVHLCDKIRTAYEIKNHDVIVYEERKFGDRVHWSRTECAKFKYDRTGNRWKLYWMRRDRKWHRYASDLDSTELNALVAEVDQDRNGAFFG